MREFQCQNFNKLLKNTKKSSSTFCSSSIIEEKLSNRTSVDKSYNHYLKSPLNLCQLEGKDVSVVNMVMLIVMMKVAIGEGCA